MVKASLQRPGGQFKVHRVWPAWCTAISSMRCTQHNCIRTIRVLPSCAWGRIHLLHSMYIQHAHQHEAHRQRTRRFVRTTLCQSTYIVACMHGMHAQDPAGYGAKRVPEQRARAQQSNMFANMTQYPIGRSKERCYVRTAPCRGLYNQTMHGHMSLRTPGSYNW